ncbi:MAG: type II toxin-antitoxin system RelB/DinJ family antitoxin [Clostridia bacterium]|nr:type II toxin-antitoxin system RelB/DinJ family antitoxin [Clostridia bacterium]
MSATTMTVRVDKEVKDNAKMIFAELGIDLSTAVNIFLKQSIREHGIPFRLKLDIPNEETKRAIRESEKGIGMSKKFSSTEELFEDLEI